MKKIFASIIAATMLALTAFPALAGVGKTIEDAVVHKHHWDVPKSFNKQCTIKKGNTVVVVNNITWLNGEELIHIKYNGCDGWTWQKHVKVLR